MNSMGYSYTQVRTEMGFSLWPPFQFRENRIGKSSWSEAFQSVSFIDIWPPHKFINITFQVPSTCLPSKFTAPCKSTSSSTPASHFHIKTHWSTPSTPTPYPYLCVSSPLPGRIAFSCNPAVTQNIIYLQINRLAHKIWRKLNAGSNKKRYLTLSPWLSGNWDKQTSTLCEIR